VTLQGQAQPNLKAFAAHREDFKLSKRATDQSKIRQAISTFNLFKSVGTDWIVPALLKHRVDHLPSHICHIFRVCLARGYTLKTWRQVTVMLISKTKSVNYTKDMAHHPI
jgi:hypothetical protein